MFHFPIVFVIDQLTIDHCVHGRLDHRLVLLCQTAHDALNVEWHTICLLRDSIRNHVHVFRRNMDLLNDHQIFCQLNCILQLKWMDFHGGHVIHGLACVGVTAKCCKHMMQSYRTAVDHPHIRVFMPRRAQRIQNGQCKIVIGSCFCVLNRNGLEHVRQFIKHQHDESVRVVCTDCMKSLFNCLLPVAFAKLRDFHHAADFGSPE